MEELTLYHSLYSRSIRVKKLLDIMEVPHSVEMVNLSLGEQNEPDYRKRVNPFGKVPTLKHNGTMIVESGAIMMYLADLFPEKNMAPPVGTTARGRYYEWFNIVLVALEPAVIAIPRSARPDAAREEMRAILNAMETMLGEPYVIGEQFTAADVLLHGELWWMDVILQVLPDGYPRLRSFFDSLSERIVWE